MSASRSTLRILPALLVAIGSLIVLVACSQAPAAQQPAAPAQKAAPAAQQPAAPAQQPAAPPAQQPAAPAAQQAAPAAQQPAAPVGADQFDTSKYKKAGPYKIGFSNISVVNSWRVQMVRELEYERTLHPEISDLFITDAGGDINKQINDVNDLMAKGINALLITPTSPEALVPAVRKVLDAGIPVIVFNSQLAGNIAPFIGTDEVEFGYVIAKWLMQQLNWKGKIIALDGIAGNSISEDRFKGLQKAIAEGPEGGKNVQILGRQPADWAYDKGKNATANFLNAFPQIDGVWSQGGAMTQGAIEAFEAAGRPLVPMTGEDNNGFMKAWKARQAKGFKAISASEPTWCSGEALKAALDALNGKPLPKSRMIPVPTITDENLDKFVRAELSDDYWTNSHLPPDLAKKYYGQ